MASSAMRLLLPGRLARFLRPLKPYSSSPFPTSARSFYSSSFHLFKASKYVRLPIFSPRSRSFCSRPPLNLEEEGPAPIDYHSLLQEDEFHELADSTIQHLLEKVEEYGDSVDIDGFDIDYGNQVLTVKLGDLGTYVLNKQTPNRQIWLSSPVSGPSRFDWDPDARIWVYRRTKSNLLDVLAKELQQLCGGPIDLS